MKTQLSNRTGLLIVRLWIEGNPRDGLRARITHTLDTADAEQSMATAANPEDIHTAVRKWIEAFVSSN